ncbi:MAG: hypothetical protein Q9218_007185 [Villophora microphyllina]
MSSPPFAEYEKYLRVHRKRKAQELQEKRKVSSSSTISADSTTQEFLTAKEQDTDLDIQFTDNLMHGFMEALQDGLITKKDYDDAMKGVGPHNTQKRNESVVLKRQKKFLTEDLDEMRPNYEKIRDAYAKVIVNKVMASTAFPKKKKSNQQKFRKDVLKYYQASRKTQSDKREPDEAYCALTGWQAKSRVKAAHIVPKALKGDELSYLFGVGEAVLSDPRNSMSLTYSIETSEANRSTGLPLEQTIEEALDSGRVVLVPKNYQSEPTNWTLVITDTSIRQSQIFPGLKWADLDGKDLQFLTSNRPARRFLYCRFVITYLECKKTGNLDWVKRVDAKGTLWTTPGPYLRKSMLLALARKVSDHFLPAPLVEDGTFEETEGAAKRPAEEEEVMADSLKVRLDSRMAPTDTDADSDSDSDSDSD